MLFSIYIMLIKIAFIICLLPIIAFCVYKLINWYDKKDTDWNKSDINGSLATSIYAGAVFIGISILAGLIVGLSLLGIFV